MNLTASLLAVTLWFGAGDGQPGFSWKPVSTSSNSVARPYLRSGYQKELRIDAKGQAIPFRGNILYFEGLGDSIVNHQPLFDLLTSHGFRVITFDYPGQGGSTGDMDDTRIVDIPKWGMKFWKQYARDRDHFPKPIIIGWSTGGLAAYWAALQELSDTVVLIAPGILPNFLVGENLASFSHPIDHITPCSLTTACHLSAAENPHLEPIFPESPLSVPHFAIDLQLTALRLRSPKQVMPSSVRGLVLLSGPDDNYVDADKTRKIIKRSAPEFEITSFPLALHEIDNEAPATLLEFQLRLLNFLL